MLPPDYSRRQPEETLIHRDQCIASTLSSFIYRFYPMAPEAVELESRFLGDDVYLPDPEDPGHFRIRSVEMLIADQVKELQRKSASITSDGLNEQIQKNSQEIKTMVAQISQQANSLHALSTLDEETIKETFADPRKLKLQIEGYPFTSRGWDIQPGQDGSFRLLVRLNEEESLQMVNLDELYAAKPETVQDFIWQYHYLERLNVLLNKIRFNLEIHEVSAQAIMPRWLISLLNRPEQLEKEIAGIANLASWFCRLDENYPYKNYSTRIFPIIKSVQLYSTRLPERQEVFLSKYLAHVATCPGVDDSARQTAQRRLETLETIASISLPSLPEPPPEITDQEWNIFQNPIAYTKSILTHSEISNKEGLEDYGEFLEFLKTSANIKNDQSLWPLIEEKLPELHQELKQFELWLGGSTKLEEVVKTCRDEIWLTITSSEITLDQVTKIVQEQLGRATTFKDAREKKIWGWQQFEKPPSTKTRFYLSDLRLESLLIYLVVKSTINEINIKARYIPELIPELKAPEYLARVKKVEKALRRKYRRYITTYEENLDEIRERRQLMVEFLQRTGSTAKDIESLRTLATTSRKRRWLSLSDENRFSILFNTFYLAKTGQIDLSSPTIQALLKEFFPEVEVEEFNTMELMLSRG